MWLVVVGAAAVVAALIVYETVSSARCGARGGVWISDKCLRKNVVLP